METKRATLKEKMKAAVVGCGYVGLVTAVLLTELGHSVVCVDKNRKRLRAIASKDTPIYEEGLGEALKIAVESGLLATSSELKQAVSDVDVVMVCVGTPSKEDGSPSMDDYVAVLKEIAKGVKSYTVVVNKSTVPPGTAAFARAFLESKKLAPSLFDVVSNPEFLREGTALFDARFPDRVVVGAESARAFETMRLLYENLDYSSMLEMDPTSAELVKYASNAFLATKISFVDSLCELCRALGADVRQVARGMGTDKRIGPAFLRAGIGWGGSCFPKDTLGLLHVASQWGVPLPIVEAAVDVNEGQVLGFVQRLRERLGGFEGKTVAVLGLAFKPGTDDVRESRAVQIVEAVESGGGVARTWDPVAVRPGSLPSIAEAVEGADAVVVATEHPEIAEFGLRGIAEAGGCRLLFDGRLVFDALEARSLGFEYHAPGF